MKLLVLLTALVPILASFIPELGVRLDASLVIQALINCYLLYIFGVSLLPRIGKKHFFTIYVLATLASVGASLSFHDLLTGNLPAIYGVMAAWALAFPGAELSLFFSKPFKAVYLVFGLIALSALLAAVSHLYLEAAGLLAGAGAGAGYTYLLMRPKKPKRDPKAPKIYDFQSGEPILNDEQFMDKMLDKISRKIDLTDSEKQRMHDISARKKR